MATKLIELEDGILVEVEAEENESRLIASGDDAKSVSSRLSDIKPMLLKAARPLTEIWHELNRDMEVDAAEVTLNFGFEAEGRAFIAKAKAGSSLSVKLVLKPKQTPGASQDRAGVPSE